MARIAAKMDLDKGFDSDAHSETSTSPRRRAPAAAAEQALPRKRDCRYLSQKSMAPGTDAADVVKDELDKYVAFGDSEGGKRTAETAEVVELEFPGEGASERYPLIEPKKAGELAPVGDIYNSAKLIVQYVVPAAHRGDLGDINSGILRSIIKACHTKNHEALKAAIEEWNAKMRKMKEDNVFALLELQAPAAPQPLINHILEQAYSRTVAPYSELLNQYRAFGNNVYGEVKSGLVREFIKNARIQPHHVFIDMGSGIGNVVLQIAGEVLAESHGVEVMDIPAKLGGRQLKEFLSRMRYYAQPCGKVRLRHANFLTDPETDEVLKRADVVFVNNYAFEPRLNQLCLAKFLDLKEGARVISLRSFVHQDRRINYRTADALESIFRVKEFHFGTDMVSWTNEGGRYFVHTVDRSMLRSYAKEAGVGL
ncbi:histone methylation protein DOT1-domain-containing protein [Hyaloraphidium curvatum]|nr:histone methylation protein DOT1-domain-containing protein [Hyaloraphidium curvatum]